MKSNAKHGLLWLFLLICALTGGFLFVFNRSRAREPVRIGFVAQLSGVQAELGVQERNAVQMALERVNEAGGIGGRPIELLIRDDGGTPDGARAAVRSLLDHGVVAVVGHATSAQTMAGLEVSNPAEVPMISPTASTPVLTGIDDFFFRVVPSHLPRAQAFARRVRERDVRTVVVVHDTDNMAYSGSYMDAFAGLYTSVGGEVIGDAGFSSKMQPDFAPLLARLRTKAPDGLLVLANDFDTAMVAQAVRLMEWRVSIFASTWSQTETLLNHGGAAVEGMEIETVYPQDRESPAYLEFKMAYLARFGRAPSFAATLGYEAASLLAEALQETRGKRESLKQALLRTSDFEGLIDTFSLDEYGDVERPFYFSTVVDGRFVTDDGVRGNP